MKRRKREARHPAVAAFHRRCIRKAFAGCNATRRFKSLRRNCLPSQVMTCASSARLRPKLVISLSHKRSFKVVRPEILRCCLTADRRSILRRVDGLQSYCAREAVRWKK